jgi:outer membrane immunogenic protein
MLNKSIIALIATLLGGSIASAADLVVKAPVAPLIPDYNWTGFYLGGFVGGVWGETNTFNSGSGVPISIDADGVFGGIHAGYDWQLPNRFVLGFRVAAPLGSSADGTTADPTFPATVSHKADLRWAVLFTGHLGYAMGPQGRWLPYVGGGLAVGEGKATFTFPGTVLTDTNTHTGFTVLTGVRYAFADNWWAALQYNYTDFGSENYTLGVGTAPRSVDFKSHSLTGMISYKFGGSGLFARY